MHRTFLIQWLAGCLLLPLAGLAGAANYYFDANGAASGSGATTGSYAWASPSWSNDSSGNSATGTLPVRNSAVFSAGNDAWSADLTLTGASGEMAGVIVQEGNVIIQSLTRIFVNGSSLQTFSGTTLTIQNQPDFYDNSVIFNTAADSTLTIAGTSSGVRNARITKTGPGLAIFQGANIGSNGGTVTINQGEFRIRNSSSLPDGANTVNTGGTLALSNSISPVRALTLAGGTLRNADGANNYGGLISLSAASRILVEAGTTLELNPESGNSVAGASVLTLDGTGVLTVSKPLANLPGLVKIGAGTAVLGVASPFTGQTTISSGVLRFTETAGVLGGVGGPISVHATLEVINAADQILANALSGAVSGTFIKQGGGSLTLSEASTFSGTTRISTGRLRLGPAGSLASATIETAVGTEYDVSQVPGYSIPAGQALSGTGTIQGNVTAASGSFISPGVPGFPGTLTFSQPLAMTGGATVRFDLASSPSGGGDLLAINGDMTLAGSNTINLAYTTLANGTYPLVRTTGGTVVGAIGSLQLAGFIPGAQIAVLQAAPGGAGIDLVVSTNNYIARDLTWIGDGEANVWQTGGAAVWQSGTIPVPFTATDRVTFDATGAANPIVTLSGELTPGSLTVDAATDFTFTGSGTLTGPMALFKSGGGRLVLTSDHGFTGGTTLAAGTIELRASSALGRAAVSNSGTLAFAPGSSLIIGNPISGMGGISQLSGINSLSGANTFDGPVIITGGTLQLGNSTALGSAGGGTSVAAGGTLDLAGISPGAETVTLAGGALANSASVSSRLAGPLVISASSSLQATGPLVLTGGIHGAADLIVSGPETVTLGGDSQRAGTITVASGGSLVITGNAGPGPLTITAGATLGGSGTAGGHVTVAGTIDSGATTQTLTFSSGLTLQAASTTRLKIQKNSSGLFSDRLVVAGTFTRGGRLAVSISGLALAAGDSVQLFSASTPTGDFANISLPVLSNGLIWDQSDLATTGLLRVISLPAVSTSSQRRDWLLNKAANNPGTYDELVMAAAWFTLGEPELGRAAALAASQALLASHTDTPEQVDLFEIWPAVDLCVRFGNQLDAQTLANVRQVVTTVTYYKDTNTSNLQTLAWVTRYLGGQLFGEEIFTSLGIANYWRTNDPNAAAQLRSHITTCVNQGFREHASRPYYDKNLLPILSLGQLATDHDMRQRALLAYEAGLAQNAATWLRGHHGVATSRSYPDVLSQYPISSLCMLWFHFGGELPPSNNNTALLAAVMNPQVSPILETAASDRSTAFTTRQFINDVHQTSFVDRDYALFSDGPLMRGNFQVYPNGVVWTEPNAARYSFLWVAKPFVDDATIYVSHPHGRQTGYYKEAQTRDAVLYIYNIPASGDAFPYALGYVPGGYRAMVNDSTASGHIFLHYGTVLIAIRSENPFTWDPQSGIAFPASAPKGGDSEFRIYGTQFAVALETAHPADFAGATPADQLAAFRSAVLARPAPGRTAAATPTASYTTRRGDALTVALSADPSTRPATLNGAPVNFNNWPVLDNPWMFQRAGGSLLTLHTASRRELLDFSNWTRRIQTSPTASAIAPVATNPGSPVDVDLSTLVTPPVESTLPLRYSTGAASQGMVVLQPDGRTARFTPAPGYQGPASFDYTVHSAGADPAQLVFLYDYEDDFLSNNWIADVSGHRLTGNVSTAGSGTGSLDSQTPYSLGGVSALSLKLNESGTSAARFTHDLSLTEHDISDADWTFATWARRASTTNHDMVWYFGSGDGFSGSGDEFYLFFPSGSNTIRLHHYSSANILDVDLVSPATATAGAWHHLAVSFTRSGLNTGIVRLYLNGALAATSTPVTWAIKQSSPMVIGGNNSTTGSGTERWFNGLLDDTALFNRVLTAQEIAALAGQPVRHFTGLSANATVPLNVMSPLDQWRQENFGTIENTGNAADDADPDADGSKNLLEYAFSTMPNAATSWFMPQPGIAAGRLTLTFPRTRSDLVYQVEGGSSLTDWTTIATNPGTVGQIVTVSDTVDISTANPPRRFLRLRVSSSP